MTGEEAIARLEAQVAALQLEQVERQRIEREWLAVLAHELRSPTAAVLGYAELVQDGTLGEIDPRAADAVRRIAAAADQLVVLLDGVDAASDRRRDETDESGPMSAYELVMRAVAAIAFDAETRNVRVTVLPGDALLHTSAVAALRALTLALAAAAKASPGRELTLQAHGDASPLIEVLGSGLRAGRDDPMGGGELSGAHGVTAGSLRLTLANESARRAGGSVKLEATADGSRILLQLPAAPLQFRT